MKTENKKKEIFSRGLYVESLRRIRLPALIILIIITAVGVLVPVSYVAEDIEYSSALLTHIDAAWANPLLLCMIFVAAPVLTFTLFSFLNKRSASDLYFSMPHTRVANYLSRIAALATAFASMILISSGVSVLMLLIFRSHFVITWSNLLPYIVGCFIGALLVSAAMCIAMSITGTVFNNIIVSGLVMFMPRFVLLFISVGVTSRFDLLSSTHGFWPHVLHSNILTGFFDYLLGLGSSGSGSLALLELRPQLYSLALAVLYFAIGCVLFCRRKSESAEHAAPSTFLRAVYRVVLTMVICVPVCLLIFISNNANYSTSIITYVWFYVAALIVFFTYELVNVKKLSALKKCLPSLAVVALLNVALIGTMHVCCRVEENFSPDADDVEYVSIVPDYYYSSRYFNDYAALKSEDIRMTDELSRSVVCDALAESIEYFENGTGPFARPYYSYIDDDYNWQCLTVKIKVGSSEKYRSVYFTESQIEKLYSALNANSEFRDTYLNLPKAESGSVYIDIVSSASGNKNAERVYDILREEVAALDFDTWYSYLQRTPSSEFADVSIYTASDGKNIRIPVSPNLTPRTAEAIANLANSECTVSTSEVIDCIEHGMKTDNLEIGSASYYTAGDECPTWIDMTYPELLVEAIDTENALDLSRDFIRITLYVILEDDGLSVSYNEFSMFVPAVENSFEIFTRYDNEKY